MNIWPLAIFVFGFLVTCSVFIGVKANLQEEEFEIRSERVDEERMAV